MNITSAHIKQLDGQDLYIEATIDGQFCMVPLEGGNRHYREIMEQIEAGTLVLDSPVSIEM
jgi:hypothetical protein